MMLYSTLWYPNQSSLLSWKKDFSQNLWVFVLREKLEFILCIPECVGGLFGARLPVIGGDVWWSMLFRWFDVTFAPAGWLQKVNLAWKCFWERKKLSFAYLFTFALQLVLRTDGIMVVFVDDPWTLFRDTCVWFTETAVMLFVCFTWTEKKTELTKTLPFFSFLIEAGGGEQKWNKPFDLRGEKCVKIGELVFDEDLLPWSAFTTLFCICKERTKNNTRNYVRRRFTQIDLRRLK